MQIHTPDTEVSEGLGVGVIGVALGDAGVGVGVSQEIAQTHCSQAAELLGSTSLSAPLAKVGLIHLQQVPSSLLQWLPFQHSDISPCDQPPALVQVY